MEPAGWNMTCLFHHFVFQHSYIVDWTLDWSISPLISSRSHACTVALLLERNGIQKDSKHYLGISRSLCLTFKEDMAFVQNFTFPVLKTGIVLELEPHVFPMQCGRPNIVSHRNRNSQRRLGGNISLKWALNIITSIMCWSRMWPVIDSLGEQHGPEKSVIVLLVRNPRDRKVWHLLASMGIHKPNLNCIF